MAIVSSVIAADNPQKDGRRWIEEIHTDQIGKQYPFTYLALNAAWDAVAAMNARVATINAQLVATEIGSNVAQVEALGSLATPTFVYSTLTQLLSALAVAYPTAVQVIAVMIGDFLNVQTQAAIMSAFGANAVRYNTIKTTFLTPAGTLAASIRSTVGTA